MSWEWLFVALPFLVVLACPAIMLWMMRGMGRQDSSGRTDEDRSAGAGGSEASAISAATAEIARLRTRLARLEEVQGPKPEETTRSDGHPRAGDSA
ncbi:MAG: DUF2933 domain-containing protein [Gemmatimonadota bacterium]